MQWRGHTIGGIPGGILSMVLDEELTMAVLNQNESLLGFLDPDEVEIEEG